jgi:predicted secreted Zn-dependent protease
MRTFGWASAVSVAVACAGAVTAISGEVHRWKDADGRVHYGDKPPPGVAAKQVAVPAPAPARPSPDVKVEESVIRPYDISGSTLAELNAAAQRSGPVSKATGKRVWGMCTWRVTWNFSRTGGGGKCAVEKFTITVGATLDLPRWTNRDAAPESVKSGWDRFAAALRLHEDGHGDIGVRAANDLASRLRALPPEKSCAELDQKVVALGERVLSGYRLLDQAYDRSTDHGATQGATLK